MDFKGTKGEWEVRGNKVFIKDTNVSIATVSVIKNFNIHTGEKVEDLEQKINALLICNANELLETLKTLIYEGMLTNKGEELAFKAVIKSTEINNL